MHADAGKLLWDAQQAAERVACFTANRRFADYEADDFEYASFSQEGGLGKVHHIFGEELNTIIKELNETLAA